MVPTITVWKDGQSVRINVDDLPEWQAGGWSSEPKKPDSPAAKSKQKAPKAGQAPGVDES